MDDSKWERWGALGGIVFAILTVAAALLPGSPPNTSDSTADMVKFVVDKGDEIRIAGYLGAIAVVPFFWFLGSLWRLLRRDEAGAPRLTVMAALGGVFSAVLGALGGILLALLVLVRSSLFGVAALTLSASVVFIRSRSMPVWLGALGILAGLVALVGGGVTVSTNDTLFAFAIFGFLLATLWVVILSILMLRHAPEAA
jgi:hypothetical protein